MIKSLTIDFDEINNESQQEIETMKEYNAKVTPWQIRDQDFPHEGNSREKLEFLLHYASLAPSSHNTQPWKFMAEEDEVQIFVDKSHWLRVADADQRELYLSIGCALENLLIAAEHFGYGCQVAYFPESEKEELAAIVKFGPQGRPSTFRDPALFDALTVRHTNHRLYESRPISENDQKRLWACCAEEHIWLYLTGDPKIKRKVDKLIIRADAIQFADPAWREELGYWIGQGVFGTPWPIAKLSELALPHLNLGKTTAKKDSKVFMSAPLVGLLSSRKNNRKSQVKVGQLFERIYLTATILGLSLQPMSQVMQIPALKDELAKLLLVEGVFPQQLFRLGYAAPEKVHTPRRSLEEVLVL
jgi:nitroreductase